MKNEYSPKHQNFKATPFPRCAGFVEKVVKHMDMPTSDKNYMKSQTKSCNTRWELDPRTGEWYKVCDKNYDFENSYPPLPPSPSSKEMFYENGRNCQPVRDYMNGNVQRNTKYMEQSHPKHCVCAYCCREKRM